MKSPWDFAKRLSQNRAALLVLVLGLAASIAAWRVTEQRIGGETATQFQHETERATEAIDALLDVFVDATSSRRAMEWDHAKLMIAHPCVLARRAAERCIDVPTELIRTPRPALLGSGVRDGERLGTVECPRRNECHLAPWCSQSHYAAYAETFGLDEFVPAGAP